MDLDRKTGGALALVAIVVLGLGAWLIVRPDTGSPACSVTPSISENEFERFFVEPDASCVDNVVASYQMTCWVVHRHSFSWESHKTGTLGIGGDTFTEEGKASFGLGSNPSFEGKWFTGTIGDRYKPRCKLRFQDGRSFTGEGYSVKL